MKPKRPPLPLAALLCAGALGACGGGEEPEREAPPVSGETTDADRPQGAPRPEYQLSTLPVFVGPRLPTMGEASQVEARRSLVRDDDWETEHLVARARPVLDAFLARLLAREGEAVAGWDELLAAEFGGATSLRPAELAIVFDGEAARVLEAAPETLAALEPGDRAALERTAADLRATLGAGPPSALPLVVSIEPRADGGFDTRVELLIDGAGGGAPVQVNATWELAWTLEGPEEDRVPRIAALRLTRYQELHAPRPLFEEVTEAVFGATRGWRADFLHGVDDGFMRRDRQMGVAFQGMQGLAVGDLDGDGLEDLYVCQQVGVPNRLFMHRPDGTVVERAMEAKLAYLDVTRSALIVDLDDDGDQDLALTAGASVLVAYNDGSGTFPRQKQLEVEGDEQFYSISAADADGDGDLDLFGCRYALGGVMRGAPNPYHDADNGATNHYWRNDGVGVFTDATEEAGFAANNSKFSLASIWEDFDADGDLDLYVVNDFGRNNLWRNDGAGRFEDDAAAMGLEDIGAGMGATCGDFDLDGVLDVYVTNMFTAAGMRIASQERFLRGRAPQLRPWYVKHASGNTLLRGRGDGTYEDVTAASGTAMGRWGWGAKFVDFDNDGFLDLYLPNGQTTSFRAPGELEGFFWRRVIDQSPVEPGSLEGYRSAFDAIQNLTMFTGRSWNGNERNNAYLNLGDGRFAESSHVIGAAFVEDARALATLDWDGDGREDLLLRSRTAPRLRLLLNRAPGANRSVVVELAGGPGQRDGIGALVTVTADGTPRSRRVTAGEGYLAQSSKRLVFGLGRAERVERLEVRWPDGTTETHEDLAVDHLLRVAQGADAPVARPLRARDEPLDLAAGTPERDPAPVDRVVLGSRLPMAPMGLPAFDETQRTVRSLRDRPVLVYVWTANHDSGRRALAELVDARGLFEASGLQVVTLAIDQGAGLARARKRVEATPFAELAGFADGRTQEFLNIVMLEVLGYFDAVHLPTSFLLDVRGRLCVIYTGPVDPRVIAADAELLAGMKPRMVSTAPISRGRWLRAPIRQFETMSQVLRNRAFEELAAFYAQLAGAAATEMAPHEEGAGGVPDDSGD